ncbi:MAG: tRNA lysidine(34) synthetase TilS [Bacteroidota bacterium]|nr:tRNA lysidine(34) synthetase TilS [Bacteroidota bacterium]
MQSLHGMGISPGEESFLVACSGGLDSTVLAHLCARYRMETGVPFAVGHVHHGLRPEADGDEEFVRALAGNLDAPFLRRRVDVRSFQKGNVQDHARTLRYAALEEMRVEAGMGRILTAHHRDDQAETVLAHFLRGAGVEGLQGIRPTWGLVLRPLLQLPKSELLRYARTHGIEWREDTSNASDRYIRNAIRRHVLPIAADTVNPSVVRVLARSASLFRSLAEYLESACETWERGCIFAAEDGVFLAVPALNRYLEFQRFLLVRRALRSAGAGEAGFKIVEAVVRLLEKQTGAFVEVGRDLIAWREADAIAITPAVGDGFSPIPVELGREIALPRGVFRSEEIQREDVRFVPNPAVECIDIDAAGRTWVLRPWREGDRFRPLGGRGSKKVGDYLRDEGVPRRLRRTIPILEGEHGIVWVCGYRLDERARITSATRNAARVEFISGGREA